MSVFAFKTNLESREVLEESEAQLEAGRLFKEIIQGFR